MNFPAHLHGSLTSTKALKRKEWEYKNKENVIEKNNGDRENKSEGEIQWIEYMMTECCDCLVGYVKAQEDSEVKEHKEIE